MAGASSSPRPRCACWPTAIPSSTPTSGRTAPSWTRWRSDTGACGCRAGQSMGAHLTLTMLDTLHRHCLHRGVKIEFRTRADDVDASRASTSSSSPTAWPARSGPSMPTGSAVLRALSEQVRLVRHHRADSGAVADLSSERARDLHRALLPVQPDPQHLSRRVRPAGLVPRRTRSHERRGEPALLYARCSATTWMAGRSSRTSPRGSTPRSFATATGATATSCCWATRCAPCISRSARERAWLFKIRSPWPRLSTEAATMSRPACRRSPPRRRTGLGRLPGIGGPEHPLVRERRGDLPPRPPGLRLQLLPPHREDVARGSAPDGPGLHRRLRGGPWRALSRRVSAPSSRRARDPSTGAPSRTSVCFKRWRLGTRELTEALDQQTATSDVLRVISSSPTAVQPVFDAIAASATRCARRLMLLVFRYDGQRSRWPPSTRAGPPAGHPERVPSIRTAEASRPRRSSSAA